jgi:hypothetical protein
LAGVVKDGVFWSLLPLNRAIIWFACGADGVLGAGGAAGAKLFDGDGDGEDVACCAAGDEDFGGAAGTVTVLVTVLVEQPATAMTESPSATGYMRFTTVPPWCFPA